MPEITPPTNCPSFFQELSPCTAPQYRALLIVPDSALLDMQEASAEEGTFRHCGDARLSGPGARTPPGFWSAEGAGRTSGDAHASGLRCARRSVRRSGARSGNLYPT